MPTPGTPLGPAGGPTVAGQPDAEMIAAAIEDRLDGPALDRQVGGERPGLKLLIELTPLAVWLFAFKFYGIITAAEVLIAATLVSLVAAYVLLGKISPMLMVTAFLVVLFGGLTIGFNEPRFFKIKPTIVNLLFAVALGYGLYSGRNFLKMMVGEALHLTAEGWRGLTIRWIGLFVVQAGLNEIIWRATNTPDAEYLWGYYKFPGLFLLTAVFIGLNVPFVRKHSVTPSAS